MQPDLKQESQKDGLTPVANEPSQHIDSDGVSVEPPLLNFENKSQNSDDYSYVGDDIYQSAILLAKRLGKALNKAKSNLTQTKWVSNNYLGSGSYRTVEIRRNTISQFKSDKSVVELLKQADYNVIREAIIEYKIIHKEDLLKNIITYMGGTYSPSVELIKSIFYLYSTSKASLVLDFAIALLAGPAGTNKRTTEIYQILETSLESLNERKKLKAQYESIFWRRLTDDRLIETLKKRFTYDADKKMLALFHHELTDADRLVYYITGETEPKKVIELFTRLLKQGFQGIEKLHNDWNHFILTPLPEVGYAFHKKELFNAVISQFGIYSEVGRTISPIQRNYVKWSLNKLQPVNDLLSSLFTKDAKQSTFPLKSKEELEDDLIIDTAMGVIEGATQDTSFFSNPDTSKQIEWAIDILYKKIPKRIEKASGLQKKVIAVKWEMLKLSIEDKIKRYFKDDKGLKARLMLHRDQLEKYDKATFKSAEDIYIQILNKNEKQAVSVAEDIWKSDRAKQIFSVLSLIHQKKRSKETTKNSQSDQNNKDEVDLSLIHI